MFLIHTGCLFAGRQYTESEKNTTGDRIFERFEID